MERPVPGLILDDVYRAVRGRDVDAFVLVAERVASSPDGALVVGYLFVTPEGEPVLDAAGEPIRMTGRADHAETDLRPGSRFPLRRPTD